MNEANEGGKELKFRLYRNAISERKAGMKFLSPLFFETNCVRCPEGAKLIASIHTHTHN